MGERLHLVRLFLHEGLVLAEDFLLLFTVLLRLNEFHVQTANHRRKLADLLFILLSNLLLPLRRYAIHLCQVLLSRVKFPSQTLIHYLLLINLYLMITLCINKVLLLLCKVLLNFESFLLHFFHYFSVLVALRADFA